MGTRRSAGPDRNSRFRRDIQGLRAIAVGAVVLYHAGIPLIPGGYIGVDVFFVISGFLITSHLISGLRRDGKVHFASFYAKRVRRILPASFVVLAVSVVAALIWYPPLLMREVWAGAVATAFYVPNYLFAAQGTNYLAETTPSLFQHYWSLGIEEQFYLVWPVLLALAFFLVKRIRVLFALVLFLVSLSFVACLYLTDQSQPWAFFSLPTRAWELGVGALVALLLSYRPRPIKGAVAASLGWLGVLIIIGCAVIFSDVTPFPSYWAMLPAVATALIIVAGEANSPGSPTAVLSTKPLMWVGTISYSLYLVHWPLLQVPQAAVGFENPLPLWATVLLSALAVPVAWLMYRFVEEPGRNGRWLATARPRRSLVAAAAASAVVVLAASTALLYSNSRPLHVGQLASDTVIASPPLVTDFVPSNLRPALRAASADQPQIYADGCHLGFSESSVADCVYGDPSAPRIVLFGDSHAAQWFPAVLAYARQHGFAVENHTKSSCPSVSADVLRNRVPYTECSTWREHVIEHINTEKPALVVLANYGVASLAHSRMNYAEAWGDALARSIHAIHAPTVVLADTPDLEMTPSVCLSANLWSTSECARTRADALNTPARAAERAVAEELGVPYVDLTEYLCSTRVCAPIVGNTLVYRDSHHITATYSAQLAEALGPRLEDLLTTGSPAASAARAGAFGTRAPQPEAAWRDDSHG